MRARLEIIFLVLLLLISPSFAAQCRTCKNHQCHQEPIKLTTCTPFSSVTPFKTMKNFKEDPNQEYVCLKIEYLNGDATELLQQCLISENIYTACNTIAKHVSYTYCDVERPQDDENDELIEETKLNTGEDEENFDAVTVEADYTNNYGAMTSMNLLEDVTHNFDESSLGFVEAENFLSATEAVNDDFKTSTIPEEDVSLFLYGSRTDSEEHMETTKDDDTVTDSLEKFQIIGSQMEEDLLNDAEAEESELTTLYSVGAIVKEESLVASKSDDLSNEGDTATRSVIVDVPVIKDTFVFDETEFNNESLEYSTTVIVTLLGKEHLFSSASTMNIETTEIITAANAETLTEDLKEDELPQFLSELSTEHEDISNLTTDDDTAADLLTKPPTTNNQVQEESEENHVTTSVNKILDEESMDLGVVSDEVKEDINLNTSTLKNIETTENDNAESVSFIDKWTEETLEVMPVTIPLNESEEIELNETALEEPFIANFGHNETTVIPQNFFGDSQIIGHISTDVPIEPVNFDGESDTSENVADDDEPPSNFNLDVNSSRNNLGNVYLLIFIMFVRKCTGFVSLIT